MRSRRGKLLVLGDSNAAMFKQLFDADGTVLGYKNVEFWYQTGSSFNVIDIGDGKITGRGKDAAPPVTLSSHAHILWAGGRLRTMAVFEPLLSTVWSDSLIRESVREYLETLPAIRNLRLLRQNFSKRITVVTTPLRSAGQGVSGVTNPDAEYWRLNDLIWQQYALFIETKRTRLLRIPQAMLTEGYLVKECYSISDSDDLHKNVSYARDLLKSGGAIST